jgi:hypothetical protein
MENESTWGFRFPVTQPDTGPNPVFGIDFGADPRVRVGHRRFPASIERGRDPGPMVTDSPGSTTDAQTS